MTSRWLVVLVAFAACGKKPDATPTGSGSAPTATTTTTTTATDPVIQLPVIGERAVAGYVDADPALPRIVATRDEVRLDDKLIVMVAALGDDMKNDKITAATAAIPKRDRLALALDGHTTYRTLFQIMTSAKQGDTGFKRFAVLATSGKRTVMVPIDLPDQRPAAVAYGKRIPGADLGAQVGAVKEGSNRAGHGAKPAVPDSKSPVPDEKVPVAGVLRGVDEEPPPDAVPQLVVTIKRDQIMVWSIDGSEGTLQSPKAVMSILAGNALGGLADTLSEIPLRRWHSDWTGHATSLVVMADANVDMQMVADVFGVVHAAKLGITLASMFE